MYLYSCDQFVSSGEVTFFYIDVVILTFESEEYIDVERYYFLIFFK